MYICAVTRREPPTEEHTVEIESAWPANPDYVIDLVPVPFTARVWAGDVLVAESSSCLRLEETRHVDRLYFPESDVNWEHFEESVAHTICPFKGEASYWTLTAGDAPEKNVVWTYREPFDEVAGIKGYVSLLPGAPADRADRGVARRRPAGDHDQLVPRVG